MQEPDQSKANVPEGISIMKSELTKEIENALRQFNPDNLGGLQLNHKRDSIRVSEVTVANSNTRAGIVDFMRAEEYLTFSKVEKLCYLNWKANASNCKKGLASGERRKRCDHPSCKFRYDENKYDNHKLIVAMEIKVTLADFKSKHGHNFIGNLNYYVITENLFYQMQRLPKEEKAPESIGFIIYKNGELVEIVEADFIELPADEMLERVWCIMKASRTGSNVSGAIKSRRRRN